jgi:hypothetical protein
MKEEENATKEAFNGTPFAQFFPGPSGRQAGALLAVFGIVGHDGHRPEHLMNPGHQAQAPIGRVQANDPGPDLVKAQSPCQESLCKGSIMRVGWREQKEER